MAKDNERKRKLEQEQLDQNATPKRLKQSQTESAKKTSEKGNGSPQVQIPAFNGTKAANFAEQSSTPSKVEKKASKKAGESDVQPTNSETAKPAAKSEKKRTKKTNAPQSEGFALSAKTEALPEAQTAESAPTSKKSKKQKKQESLPVEGGATTAAIPAEDVDVSMIDVETPLTESKRSKKQNKQQQREEQSLVKVDDEADTEETPDKQRRLDKTKRRAEKRARRQAAREVRAGLREDEELTAPNSQGWWLSPPSAGRYLPHDPIFVTDENGDECLIAATIREVQLLHLDDSLIARTHVVPDGRSIQCYSLSASYPDHVDIAYDNGAKVQWDWTTGATIKSTYPGQETVISMTTASLADGRPETWYIAAAQGTYSIISGRKSFYSTYRRLRNIQVYGEANYIVCFGTTALILGRKKDNSEDEYVWVEIPLTTPPQCLDARLVHHIGKSGKLEKKRPELILALGNTDGHIHLYSKLSSLFASPAQVELPTPRILHWHREAVSSVKFPRDGNYLISGGKESVLVIWQLETGQKQFLPHLTAEIERVVVSPNGTQYALQMGDNSIMVLSTSELKPVANFAGLQMPVQTEIGVVDGITLPSVTAALHPNDTTQLLLTVPSNQPKTSRDIVTRPFLETFDVRNARHISRQALARNNVTDFNLGPENTPINPPDVSLLALSTNGEWLATVDEWIVPATDLEHTVAKTTNLGPEDLLKLKEEQEKRREVYLKFWKWDAAHKIWTLSTRADAPHGRTGAAYPSTGAGRVLQLKSDPSSNGFTTVGADGVIKIWRSRTKTRQGLPLKEQDGSHRVEWFCKKEVSLPITVDLDDDRADSAMEVLEVEETEGDEKEVSVIAIETEKTLAVVDAALAFSPDGSMLACSTVTVDESMQPLVHFINPNTGALVSTKAGIIPSDQEVKEFGFLDRYLIVLTYSSIRVWNLVDDSHHYTIALPGQPEDQEDAKLAINQTDETFAVVSTFPIAVREDPVPQIVVYGPKKPDSLFEAELESMPAAVLTGNGTKGYTILFEDGTIRTLSNNTATARDRRLSLVPAEDTAETIEGAEGQPDADAASALALIKATEEDAEMADTMVPLAIGENEDDRPVVRPEQLASIFDVGQSFAMPPVRDMFQAVVGLYARKPRGGKVEDGMEL